MDCLSFASDAEKDAMKCTICGRSSPSGAKLCSDCRAARKRAFAATVTQPLLMAAAKANPAGRLLRPSQSVAATVRRAAEQALFVKPPPALEPTAKTRRGLLWLAASLAVIVMVAAYATHRMAGYREPDVQGRAVTQGGGDRSATSAPTEMSVMPIPTALKPGGATGTTAVPETSEPAVPVKTEPGKRATGKQRVAVAPPAPAPLMEHLAAAASVAPVLEPPAPPPPNPWQSMNESLAQCAGGVIDRMMCDLRVRQQYCSGYWGKVPQCPGAPANDHGQ